MLGKEVLDATLVSPTWEQLVSESQTCMKKVEVKIIGRKYYLNCQHQELRHELIMLSASQRRYQNLTFYAQRPGYLTKDVIKLCESRKGKWKSIRVWSEKFVDEQEFERFLLSFQENVEVLDLRNLTIIDPSNLKSSGKSIEMKKLQVLRLCNLTKIPWLICRLKCVQLKELEVENGCDETLIRFFATTKTVRRLSITKANFSNEFFDALSSFKLSEVRIKALTAQSEGFQKGLRRFLVLQADNILALTLDITLSSDILQTIFKLPNLKILNIATSPGDLFVDCFPTNSSIIELRLRFNCNFDDLWNIIKSTPNLKILEVASVKSSERKVGDLVEICLPRLEKLELQ